MEAPKRFMFDSA